jgi:hypothetical protein
MLKEDGPFIETTSTYSTSISSTSAIIYQHKTLYEESKQTRKKLGLSPGTLYCILHIFRTVLLQSWLIILTNSNNNPCYFSYNNSEQQQID